MSDGAGLGTLLRNKTSLTIGSALGHSRRFGDRHLKFGSPPIPDIQRMNGRRRVI